METKECIKCKETKPFDQFHKLKHNPDIHGLDYYCKYCRIGTAIKSRYHNKKKCTVSECETPHYAKGMCRVHYSRMQRTGTLESKVKSTLESREKTLRLCYLLSLEEFNQMAINGCQICGDKSNRALHVDHDHSCCDKQITCGKCIRGVLCSRCNTNVEAYEAKKMRDDNPLKDKVKEYLNG